MILYSSASLDFLLVELLVSGQAGVPWISVLGVLIIVAGVPGLSGFFLYLTINDLIEVAVEWFPNVQLRKEGVIKRGGLLERYVRIATCKG